MLETCLIMFTRHKYLTSNAVEIQSNRVININKVLQAVVSNCKKAVAYLLCFLKYLRRSSLKVYKDTTQLTLKKSLDKFSSTLKLKNKSKKQLSCNLTL